MEQDKLDASMLPGPASGFPLGRWLSWILIIGVFIIFGVGYLPVTREAAKTRTALNSIQGQLRQSEGNAFYHPNAEVRLNKTLNEIQQLGEDFRAQLQSDRFLSQLEDSFRLFEFEQRRFVLVRETIEVAEENQVALPEGFRTLGPVYRQELAPAQLHWWELEFFHHVLQSIMRNSKGAEVRHFSVEPPRPVEGTPHLLRLSMIVEIAGTPDIAQRVLEEASRLSDESRSGFFIEGLDMRSGENTETASPRTIEMVFEFVSYLEVTLQEGHEANE